MSWDDYSLFSASPTPSNTKLLGAIVYWTIPDLFLKRIKTFISSEAQNIKELITYIFSKYPLQKQHYWQTDMVSCRVDALWSDVLQS